MKRWATILVTTVVVQTSTPTVYQINEGQWAAISDCGPCEVCGSSGTTASLPTATAPVPAAAVSTSTGPVCQKASSGDCYVTDRVNPNGSHVPEPGRYSACNRWPCVP